MTKATPLIQAYEEHEWELKRFLHMRLGSPATAADLAQDMYVKLCNLEQAEPVRNTRAFLFSMAANLATDHQRKENRRSAIRAEAGDVAFAQADVLDPERQIMAKAELAYLEAEIARLSPRCRRVFFLARFEGRSQAEIAEELGVGLSTVYKELKTAMALLREGRRAFNGEAKRKGGE